MRACQSRRSNQRKRAQRRKSRSGPSGSTVNGWKRRSTNVNNWRGIRSFPVPPSSSNWTRPLSSNLQIGRASIRAVTLSSKSKGTDDMSGLDPVTLAVIQNGLQQVCNEMDLAFVRAAFSPVIAEGLDRSDGIYAKDNGEL